MTDSFDRFSDAPISRLVGLVVLPGQAGEATVEVDSGPRHHNPMQRVHGGLLALLADAAMGIAFGRTLLDSEEFSTIEMKVNFIRPIRDGRLVAKAKVVERGLRIGFVECEITDQRRRRVATASCTCTLLTD